MIDKSSTGIGCHLIGGDNVRTKISHNDGNEVFWVIEHGATGVPDINDMRFNAPCICGELSKEIHTILRNPNHDTGFRASVHRLICAKCRKYTGDLPNKVLKQDAKNFVLYFGKYNGKKLEEIPKSYLEWCVKNLDSKNALKQIKVFLE